jgi:hypothetical protein
MIERKIYQILSITKVGKTIIKGQYSENIIKFDFVNKHLNFLFIIQLLLLKLNFIYKNERKYFESL